MPITRKHEPTDPWNKYILLVWDSKFYIIGVAILATILTYILLLFAPEKFRVNAELYVNQIEVLPDVEPSSPDTVTDLLKSQSVLSKVRDDFANEYQLSPPPPIEEFAKQFSVKSSILQDTTVRKQISPVLGLEVESRGSSETRYIMTRWIHHFINDFGNFTTLEAITKRDAYLKEKERLEDEIVELETLRAQYDAQLPYLRRILAENLDTLTPSFLRGKESTGNEEVRVDFTIHSTPNRTGLLERYTNLELQLRSSPASTTASAELQALGSYIEETRAKIAEAEKNLAAMTSERLKTTRRLELLATNQEKVNEALSRFITISASAVNSNGTSEYPASVDIRALSMPVSPDMRVWPKRTSTALVVGILAGVLSIFFVLGRTFLGNMRRENEIA